MDGLLKSIETLLMQRLISTGESYVGKSKVGWGLIALSALLLCTSICFICVGAYLWLSKNYTPDIAAFGMGVIFFVISVGMAALGKYTLHYRHHYVRDAKDDLADCLDEARAFASEELEKVVAENPKMALFLAALAGFVAHERFI